MILYFTSTGNCKYIAEQLAEELCDTARSITEADSVELSSGEKLGFVFPTYFWRLPSIVDDFLKSLRISSEDKEPYIYFIATYGSTCGGTGRFVKKHLKSKGYALSASYSIKTADDWTVLFDISDKGEVEKILAEEKTQLEDILPRIKSGERGNRMKDTLPMIAVCGSGVFYNSACKTRHLHVEGDCIGCGLCEKECPLSAIRIENGRPVWIKESCTMCLHCLHSCPKFAIQYDNKTQNHGQYKHP